MANPINNNVIVERNISNKISNENSTITTLGLGGVFNGSYVNCELYDFFGVLVSSNAKGTLLVFFSADAINDDIIYTTNITNLQAIRTLNITEGEFYPFDCIGRFVKIRFTSDAVDVATRTRVTSTLRINSPYVGMNGLTVRLNDPGSHSNGAEIGMGLAAQDIQRNDFYGASLDWDVSYGEEIVCVGTPTGASGNVFCTFPLTATKMITASTDATDTILGTGAREWLLIGLDIDGNEICEVFDLNGQTPVTSTFTYFRIQEGAALTAGSDLTNNGTIMTTDINDSFVAGVPQLRVYDAAAPRDGFTKSGVFTVPKGKIMLHIGMELSTTIRGDLNNVTLRLKARNDIAEEVSDKFYIHDNTFVDLRNTRARISGQDVLVTAESSVNNIELHLKMTTILSNDIRRSANFTP